MAEPESWEQGLADLKLDDKQPQADVKQDVAKAPSSTPVEAPAAVQPSVIPAENGHSKANPIPSTAGAVGFLLPDPALLSALLDQHKERALVLHMEEEVLNFIADTSRDILEFPVEYSNYQRMLAHKVAQYHSLQTTTADYEGNECRVVAHRTSMHDKNKPLLSSLDMTTGSTLALAAKTSGPWQDAPKLLRRQPNRHERSMYDPTGNPSGNPRTTTPKDREEAYDRARARIFSDTDGVMGGPGRGGIGRGGPIIAGRGRRGGGRDRGGELHDSDYTRGMNRFGAMGMYEHAMPGMAPAMMMMPQGTPAMYGMPAQPAEMAWGGAMYMGQRQPPPPPPTSSSSGSYTSKAGSAAMQQGMWATSAGAAAAGGAVVPTMVGVTPAGAQMAASNAAANAATTAVPPPPPPPPPPHAAARAYPVPTMMAATPYQTAGAAPMAMYPGGAMQPMQGMGNAMYAYPMPPGSYGYAVVSPEAAMAMAHGQGGHVGAYPGAAYPAAAMQAMGPQGYGTGMYASPRTPGMAPGMAPGMVPHAPGSPGMAMYAPMAMHGYAMQYPMQPMQAHAGMAGLTTAGSGGLYNGLSSMGSGHLSAGTGYHMNGRGGGRGGGYNKHNNHQQGSQQSSAANQYSAGNAASGPSSTTSLGNKHEQSAN